MNKYAIVMSASAAYLEMANSIINSCALYGNDVDIHLIVDALGSMEGYCTYPFPPNVFIHKVANVMLPNIKPPKKRTMMWNLKFCRYHHAYNICPNYSSILILDGDMLMVDNIMEQFKLSEESGKLVMVRNLCGVHPPELATLNNVKNSVSPSFHCTGTFFNCQNFRGLLKDMIHWSTIEGHSDMATLFRTIIRTGNPPVKEIIPLKNQLWIWTRTYSHNVVESKDEKGRPALFFEGERIKTVHGKWTNRSIRWRELAKIRDWPPEKLEGNRVYRNIRAFLNAINWINRNGPVTWFADKGGDDVLGRPR